jgi:hypothetical protein
MASFSVLTLGMRFFIAAGIITTLQCHNQTGSTTSTLYLTTILSAVLGLGSLAWAGHLVHVALPTDSLLFLGCDPCALPEGAKTVDLDWDRSPCLVGHLVQDCLQPGSSSSQLHQLLALTASYQSWDAALFLVADYRVCGLSQAWTVY